jgi:hypothetical protein
MFGNRLATVGYGGALFRQLIHITKIIIYCLPKRGVEDANIGGEIWRIWRYIASSRDMLRASTQFIQADFHPQLSDSAAKRGRPKS